MMFLDLTLSDIFSKLIEIGSVVCAVGLFLLKEQQKRHAKDEAMNLKLADVKKKTEEQERHLESQDERFEEFKDMLQEIQKSINNYGVLEEKVKNLQQENQDRKAENKTINAKLDTQFKMLSRIEVQLTKK